MPEVSKEDLLYLTVFLSNVELHKSHSNPKSECHDYWPEDCIRAIYGRWEKYKLSEILARLEMALIK